MPAKLRLVETVPATEMHRVGRKSDAEYGRDGHKYLRPEQVAALITAAKAGRYGQRDALMISLAYHHGLRVTELVELRWNAIDFKRADIAINRLKGSKSNRQPLQGDDLRALRALHREGASEEYIFVSERGGPMTRDAFNKLLKAAAKRVGVDNAYPHALRHACGHALAVKGRDMRLVQEYMGHSNVQNTARYMDGVSGRFRGIWD
jgi:type 1 fimbriae regulatory protein FimB/type 1 fimbriae regulatory protein FimE